jgi:hypothetical protein
LISVGGAEDAAFLGIPAVPVLQTRYATVLMYCIRIKKNKKIKNRNVFDPQAPRK